MLFFVCLGLLPEAPWCALRRRFLTQGIEVPVFPSLDCFPDTVFVDGSSLDTGLPDAKFAGMACVFFLRGRQVAAHFSLRHPWA